MDTNNKKIEIFIDGGNFYHLVLKKLGLCELDFDFDKFANFLADGRKIVPYGKRFYIGSVREKIGDEKSKAAMSKQGKLFTTLKLANWQIKTSKLRSRLERIIIDDRVSGYKKLLEKGIKSIEYERKREKGIDVKLATDLIAGAIDNRYDTALIISSDGDLIPAIDWVRNRMNKKVEYIGFSIINEKNKRSNTKPLQTMIGRSDIQRILVKSDLDEFIKEKLI